MKKIIFLFIILGLVGCETVPPSTGPTLTSLTQGIPAARHRVEVGETLWKISKIYGVDIDDIIRLNHLAEDSTVEVGQIILIPGQAGAGAIHANIQNAPVISAGDDFIWPVRGRVISGFGSTYHNLINKGINIQTSFGADVFATRSGRVVFYSNNFGNYSKTIIIDHGDGLRSVYSRFSEIYVKPGDNVQRGALLGRVGSSIRDKNNYLHFEIRKGAVSQNPLFFLS